jgi:hypothetical protein
VRCCAHAGYAALLQLAPLVLLWADGPVSRRPLPQTTYARMMLALIALAILGAGLMLLTWLGGRYVRKLARHSVPTRRHDDDAWYQKPLVPSDPLIEPPDDDQQPV